MIGAELGRKYHSSIPATAIGGDWNYSSNQIKLVAKD
jgi:hypothetical protein